MRNSRWTRPLLIVVGTPAFLAVIALYVHFTTMRPSWRSLNREFPSAQHIYSLELQSAEGLNLPTDASQCRLAVRMAAHCKHGPCLYHSPAVSLRCGPLQIPWHRAHYLGEKKPTLDDYAFQIEYEGARLFFRSIEGGFVFEDSTRQPALRVEGRVSSLESHPHDCERSYLSFFFLGGNVDCTYEFLGVDGR